MGRVVVMEKYYFHFSIMARSTRLFSKPSRERPCQLLADVLARLPVRPGKVAKENNEYVRKGTAVVLLISSSFMNQKYQKIVTVLSNETTCPLW